MSIQSITYAGDQPLSVQQGFLTNGMGCVLLEHKVIYVL